MNELILLAIAENPGPQSGSLLGTMTPLLLMFGIFYFIMIRPQQKRQKAHREMLGRLKKGDRVITTGGLIGTLFALTDDELVVELAERIKVRVARGQVSLYQPSQSEPEKKGK